MDQVELEIYRVHGLTDKTDNRGSVWIKFELGYPKDEKIGKGFTQSYRSDHDTVNMVNMDYKTPCYVKRARSTQMAFQKPDGARNIPQEEHRQVRGSACLSRRAGVFSSEAEEIDTFPGSVVAMESLDVLIWVPRSRRMCQAFPPTIPLDPMSCSALHLPFTQSRWVDYTRQRGHRSKLPNIRDADNPERIHCAHHSADPSPSPPALSYLILFAGRRTTPSRWRTWTATTFSRQRSRRSQRWRHRATLLPSCVRGRSRRSC
ncbi:unnamed protein product [Scytosiphon promiscuus]